MRTSEHSPCAPYFFGSDTYFTGIDSDVLVKVLSNTRMINGESVFEIRYTNIDASHLKLRPTFACDMAITDTFNRFVVLSRDSLIIVKRSWGSITARRAKVFAGVRVERGESLGYHVARSLAFRCPLAYAVFVDDNARTVTVILFPRKELQIAKIFLSLRPAPGSARYIAAALQIGLLLVSFLC